MRIYCNDQPYEIPTRWEDITFEMFLRLAVVKSESERLSVLLGMDEGKIRSARIRGFEQVLSALSFMDREAPLIEVPKKILGYEVPANLELEQVGRYEDLKLIMATFPEGDKLPVESLAKYADMCGVIFQPDYMDSDDKKKEEFAKRFMGAPCLEVLAIGNFLLWKLIALRMGIKNPSPKSNTPLRRFRLALTAWRKHLAFTVRFYFWKRKLGLIAKGY